MGLSDVADWVGMTQNLRQLMVRHAAPFPSPAGSTSW
jgi:hypothetical protein